MANEPRIEIDTEPTVALAKSPRYQDELRASQLRAILEAENRVLQTSQQVVEALLAFHEVEPDQALPPQDWVERYGQDAADKRLRVARSGWLPTAHAPNAVKIAAQVMVGIAKARGQIAASAAMPAGDVNVRISLPSPTDAAHPAMVYPSKEID